MKLDVAVFKTRKSSAKCDVEAIKQTMEFSTLDFPFLSVQFIVLGVIFFLPKILESYLTQNTLNTVTSYVTWIALIPMFIYHLLTRKGLKKHGIYTFQLYDTWGFVWFLFGLVNFVVCLSADILSDAGRISENLAAGVFLISGVFEIIIATVMLTVTGFVLKNGLLKAVSMWIIIITPFMITRSVPDDAYVLNNQLSAALRNLADGVNEIKFIICLIYIVIGACYISKRQVKLNGIE